MDELLTVYFLNLFFNYRLGFFKLFLGLATPLLGLGFFLGRLHFDFGRLILLCRLFCYRSRLGSRCILSGTTGTLFLGFFRLLRFNSGLSIQNSETEIQKGHFLRSFDFQRFTEGS